MGTKKKNEQLFFVDAWTSYIRQHSSKIYIQICACFFRQQYFRSTYLDGQLEVLNVDFAALVHICCGTHYAQLLLFRGQSA